MSVHWHAGVGNIIRGTTKNFFATSGFKSWLTSLHIFGILLMFVFPLAAMPFVRGWARVFAMIAVALPMIAETGVAIEFECSAALRADMPDRGIDFLLGCWRGRRL